MKRKQLRRVNKWRDRVSKHKHWQRYVAIRAAAIVSAEYLKRIHERGNR